MKSYSTLLSFLACLVTIEAALYFGNPYGASAVLSSPLLHMAYYKPIRPERILAAAKLDASIGRQAEFVQIGDSTGLVAVRPKLLAPYLPSGWRYLNASMQVPALFQGMETMAERVLRKDARRKYLVGIFSLFHLGSRDEGFGDEIASYYGTARRFAQYLPSLRYRPAVTEHFYYPLGVSDALDFRGQLLPVRNVVASDDGWIGIDMHQLYAKHFCRDVRFEPEVAMQRMESLAALAKRYDVTLILALGPVRCDEDDTTRLVQKELAEFHRRHPEVVMPLPFPFHVPPDYLGDEVHVTSTVGAEYFSKKWGEALKNTLFTGAPAR